MINVLTARRRLAQPPRLPAEAATPQVPELHAPGSRTDRRMLLAEDDETNQPYTLSLLERDG